MSIFSVYGAVVYMGYRTVIKYYSTKIIDLSVR